ncbi:hypothetical protein BV25DRAFT_1820615 [Artomyces pyxidatus]|uniref:Uncharacterized protein n=1 Tax=Artomyces pyxidatus TaxID=48021 RepID=A0ACB8TDV1_9AGAM|nr:hypothetical protein BV25DRAFT_1820615 [Artomyces pyxidatus]
MPVLCCETQVWPLPIRQMLHEDDWALMEIPMTKSRDHPRLTHLDLARYPQQFEACAIEHGISSTTWLGSRPPSTVDPYRPVDPHPLLLPNDPYRVDAPVLPSAGPPQPEVKGSLIKDALFNPGTGNLRALASTWVPVNRQPPPRKGKGKQGQTRKDTDQRHANGGPDPRRGGGRSDHHPTAQTWRPRPEGGGMGWGRG